MQELIDKIYLVMGVDSTVLPLPIVEHFLSEWLSVYPESDCLAIYNTIVSCYEWLIRQASATDAVDGVVKREKELNVEVEMFERKVGKDANTWQYALDMFEQDPSASLPSCRDELVTSHASMVVIGGCYPNSVAEFYNSQHNFCGYRPHGCRR